MGMVAVPVTAKTGPIPADGHGNQGIQGNIVTRQHTHSL